MPTIETEAFALRTYPFSEHHKVCVFFTRQVGVVRAVAHGSRRLKSKYGAGLELFSQVHLKFREREGRDLVELADCELVKSHFEAAANPEIAAILSYWSELITEFLPAHQPNDHIYRLLAALLPCVESELDATDALLRYFETWLLKLSGFYPDLSLCVTCGTTFPSQESLYLARDGTPECASCSERRGLVLSPASRHLIGRILRCPPAEFATVIIEPQTGRVLEELNQHLIRTSLERELKAYTVLKQLREFSL